MKNVLYIDTSNREEIVLRLKINDQIFTKKQIGTLRTNTTLLPLIVDFISEKKISLEQIDGLEVNTGPGSFTGIRVGVTIANILSFILNIPVNGKKFSDNSLVVPQYF